MNNWYSKETNEVCKKLGVDEKGLSKEEAKKRLEKNGRNELPKPKKDSVLKIFFSEFNDPIVLLLLVAIIASFAVGEVIDAVAIIFIVLVDVLMGTYQENKANNIAEALSKLVTVKSKVMRNGEIISVPSEELVTGDIVLLESGDKISADLRLLEVHNFMVDESILTGESIQVSKSIAAISGENLIVSDQGNMVFSGTTVVTGRATGIVVATGLETEIGKIAHSISTTKDEKSPLTLRVEKLSKQISALVLVVAAIITVLLIIKDVPYHEIFLSVVALAVSAMPEGLPLALTMALTIASNKMAKKNVVAKKLHSVESLGSCTVIASDKTGTLTVNEQTAKKILLPNNKEYDITGVGYEYDGKVEGSDEYSKEIAFLGTINNEAVIDKKKRIGDSIDIAFLVLGKKEKVDTSNIRIIDRIPYESENKYSAVFYEKDGEAYCTVKGSLEKVNMFCSNIHLNKRADLDSQNESLASRGYRVIAIATGKIKKKDSYKEEDIKKLTFMGMVGFIDPIRKEVIESINECRSAGIKVLMITGDHPLTAFSISKELGLTEDYNEVTTGVEVDEYLKKNKSKFDEFVKSKKVFTRVTPLQKLAIVESLKRQGEYVAVTGDGVNDAPALKSANIGVAMGSGTDIARETAKMIIIDDNFKSIVAGVKEGRVAFANIRKIIYFLLSCGLAEVLFFCLSIVFNMPMPLVAIQLLWLNIVTDGIQDFALSFEKAEKNVMKEKQKSSSASIIDKSLLVQTLTSGLVIGVLVFIVWYYLINIIKMDVSLARGYIMLLMVFMQNIHVFNCRSEKQSAFKISVMNNPLVVISVICCILLQVVVMEVDVLAGFLQTAPVPLEHVLILFLVASIVLLVVELYKEFVHNVKQED